MNPVCSEFIAVILGQWKRQLLPVKNHFDQQFILNYTTMYPPSPRLHSSNPFYLCLYRDQNIECFYSDHYCVLIFLCTERLVKCDQYIFLDATSSWKKTIFMNN